MKQKKQSYSAGHVLEIISITSRNPLAGGNCHATFNDT